MRNVYKNGEMKFSFVCVTYKIETVLEEDEVFGTCCKMTSVLPRF